MGQAPAFGEEPLPQVVAAAAAMRRMVDLLVSLEHEHPVVDDMVSRMAEWEAGLAEHAVLDALPRFGADAEEGRLYLRHAFDVADFNPCFPEYRFDRLVADDAEGSVNFPLAFEGPPGSVHGGVLGLFFDCVVQQHNCLGGYPSGMTRSMTVSYRRPVPLLEDLRFDVVRTHDDRRVQSTARLLQGAGEGKVVLCSADVVAVTIPPKLLDGIEFATRRSTPVGES